MLIKPLAQLRLRTTARRLARVKRLVLENLGENLSHRSHHCAPQHGRNRGGRPHALFRKIAGPAPISINATRRFCRAAVMLLPLSGSEKDSVDLRLIGTRPDGRIGSLGGI